LLLSVANYDSASKTLVWIISKLEVAALVVIDTLLILVVWRDKMDVPSLCTIVKTIE
jgi:hypothetical protein